MPVQSMPSTRDVLTVLFKHRGKMLLTFLVTVAGVLLATLLQAPVYESSSTLLIRFGRQFIYRSEAGRGLDDIQNRSRAAVVNAEIDILKSDDLLQEVIRDVGLARIYPDLGRREGPKGATAALGRMAEAYRVRGMDESNTLRVAFEHTSPEVAAAVVNAAVARFTEKHLEAFGNPKMVSFYEEKVALFRGKLTNVGERIRDYQLANATVDLGEQRSLLLRELNQVDSEIGGTETRVSGVATKVKALEREIAAQSAQSALYEESEARSVEEQLLQLKLRERELRSQFKDTDRQVVNVQKQIAIVEAFLGERARAGARRVRVGRNQVHDSLEIALGSARAELAELTATLPTARARRARIAQELESLPAREQQLHELQRERDAYEATYANYQKRLDDARVYADMDREQIADVSVIQRALPPARAIRPDRRTALTVGLVVGLCLALGVAFGFEFLGSTWDAPGAAAEDLGIPVLGTIRYREGFGMEARTLVHSDVN